MALVRWSPETELTAGYAALQRQFAPVTNPLMTHYPINPVEQPYFATVPPVDLIDQHNEFVVKAEVPGVDPANLKITVANNILTIRGDRLAGREAKTENYFWAERATGAFQRSITLPVSVEPTQVSAMYDNGILTVHLPKSREATSVEIGLQGTVGFGRQTTIRGSGGQSNSGRSSGKKNRSRNT